MLPYPPLPREDLDFILAHTPGLWEELRGQSIFITGGTGFFGVWLLESFVHANEKLDLGARAIVLSRNPEGFLAKVPHLAERPDLEFVSGDVRNFVFPRGNFPFIIHAATTIGALVEPVEMFDTIVEGTRQVLEFAATHGARKLLLTSSGAVYGRQPSDLTHIPEDYSGAPDPLDPSSAYGVGKRVAELMCCTTARAHGFDAKIARCFAFVGPHLPLTSYFAIGNFIGDVLDARPIVISGDGTAYRSYLYAADLTLWLWTILFRGKTVHAYNVGSARDLTITQIAQAVNQALGNHSEVHIAQQRVFNQPVSRYVPDVRRAEEELGLRDWCELDSAIHKTATWYRFSRAEGEAKPLNDRR